MTEQHPVPIGTDMVTTADDLVVASPYDGHEIGRVPSCDAGHVEAAVAAAHASLVAGDLPVHERAEILQRAVEAVTEERDALARIIAEEAAKPIRTATVEAERTAITFQAAADEARRLAGEMVPVGGFAPGAGKLAFTIRVPRGVVAAISPFNFPLNLVAHKLAPAIAAGCPVVLKPASQTPFSALALVDLLTRRCGLPPGWVNVVTGPGPAVGDPLVCHSDVAVVTFTGSPSVGWSIAAKASRKKVGLELGNNAPVIIDETGDWPTAAAKIAVAGFSHAGQSCISTQRIYVHSAVAEDFTDALVGHVAALVVGDPMDRATDVSALIHPDETTRVKAWIDEAVAAGAQLAHGGSRHDRLLEPAVLTGVTSEMAVSRHEVFGPVVGVATFDDLDDAIARANDTDYGLHAAIFSTDLARALEAATRLDFGGVLVNEVPTFRTDQMPYGGIRDSGNTTEGPRYSVREMTREKLLVLQP